jgi:hypothetical protein
MYNYKRSIVDKLKDGATRIQSNIQHSYVVDTMHERNILMSQAYPRLKTFCQERGYEFQVVDMRWGIRDEATDDHVTTELCMKELELCQKLSTGPNFIVSILTLLSRLRNYIVSITDTTVLFTRLNVIVSIIDTTSCLPDLRQAFCSIIANQHVLHRS